MVVRGLCLIFAVAAIAFCQAGVEYGALAGMGGYHPTLFDSRTLTLPGIPSGGTREPQVIGQPVGGQPTKGQSATLLPVKETMRPQPRRRGSKASQEAEAPAEAKPPQYEDPLHISAGLKYDDMIDRFGPPSLQVVASPDARLLIYATSAGRLQVDVLNGKVKAVHP